jgi:hypothetical protein
MVRPARSKLVSFIVAVLAAMPAATLAGETSVRFEAGVFSAQFEAATTAEALAAIRRATGLEIVGVVPASQKTITLTIEDAPLERFLARVAHALDLGGYAFVRAPDATADLGFLVARGGEAAVPVLANSAAARASDDAAPASPTRPISVPFLIPTRESDSMKLGAPGQVIVVDSPPIAKIKTSACDGGDAAVQSAVITDAGNTYLTSLIVCAAGGVRPGQTLRVAPPSSGGPAASDEHYSRFTATSR